MKRQLDTQRLMLQSQLQLGSLYNEDDTGIHAYPLHGHELRDNSSTPDLGYGMALPWENNKRSNPFRSKTPEMQRI